VNGSDARPLLSCSVALFQEVPASKSATAAAIFSCANQLGSATGSAIVATIQANVGTTTGFSGTAAALWFLLAINAVAAIAVIVFMKPVAATLQSEKDKTGKVLVPTEEDPEKIVRSVPDSAA
jgi:hypothetical protein